jgi:predicted helicase
MAHSDYDEAVARVADAIRLVEGPRSDPAMLGAVAECLALWQLGHEIRDGCHGLDARIVRALRSMPRSDGADAIDKTFESLLAKLEPAHRTRRGAFFTPLPLARFVLRQAQTIVAQRFAGEPVVVVDPAAGAGVFVELARGFFADRSARFVAQEIDEASAAVLRTRFAGDARIRVRAIDTLRDETTWADGGEILVVLGNPPFRGRSNSDSPLVAGLLRGLDAARGSATESYYHVDGEPLDERNPKWLQDDCVKFVRYAQWQLERARRGVIAFVCTQAFVHQPTFRAMRRSLSQAHHEVRVLDLHGNTKKLERAPDGSKDENVFAIQQGVCVLVLIRDGEIRSPGRVLFADLWGRRLEKLAALEHEPTWRIASAAPPRFAFEPEDDTLRADYERGIPLDALFLRFSPAVVTGRDGFAIARDAESMRERIAAIGSTTLDDEAFRTRFLRPRDRIDVANARRRTRAHAAPASRIVPCLYRPFDARVLLDLDPWVERARRDVMRAFDGSASAVAILARRQSPPARGAPFVFATRNIPIDGVIRSDNHGSESVFPLALGGTSNLASDAVARLTEGLGLAPSHREVFAYAYATLHAPAYRTRFAKLLRRDYPRIPLPRDGARFLQLARFGESLLTCHLHWRERAVTIEVPAGPFRVRTPRHANGAVDAGARFEHVSERAWRFEVGGYQPLRKWLDDRVGETLDPHAIADYGRIVGAIEETLGLTDAIDAVFDA